MLSHQPRHARWLLWLLALSALCFTAAQYPELRAHLRREKPPAVQRQ